MSELKQRFDAVSDRIKEIGKLDPKTLSQEEKAKYLEELATLGGSLGQIALEKMKLGHSS